MSRVQVEHLADDFPLTVELKQIEKIRKAMTRPIVGVNTDIGAGSNNVDRGNFWMNVFGGAVGIVPVKQALDRAAK